MKKIKVLVVLLILSMFFISDDVFAEEYKIMDVSSTTLYINESRILWTSGKSFPCEVSNIKTEQHSQIENNGYLLSGIYDYYDIENIKEMNCKSELTDYSFINYLRNLEILTINGGTNLTSLDFSNNLKLREFNYYGVNSRAQNYYIGALNNINLESNVLLTKLSIIGSSSLTNLDLSSNKKLESLTIKFTGISEIDLNNNSSITNLELSNNNDLDKVSLGSMKNLQTANIVDNSSERVLIKLNSDTPKENITINNMYVYEVRNVDYDHKEYPEIPDEIVDGEGNEIDKDKVEVKNDGQVVTSDGKTVYDKDGNLVYVKNGQQVKVPDTMKTAFIGYLVGSIVLILGVMIIIQSVIKNKEEFY